MALKQNNLVEATTEQGFPTEVGLPISRQVTLDDGAVVTVESVTPEKMATVLKSHFVTPGEKYVDNGNNLNGVVQNYNESSDTVSSSVLFTDNSIKEDEQTVTEDTNESSEPTDEQVGEQEEQEDEQTITE